MIPIFTDASAAQLAAVIEFVLLVFVCMLLLVQSSYYAMKMRELKARKAPAKRKPRAPKQ